MFDVLCVSHVLGEDEKQNEKCAQAIKPIS